VYNTKIVVIVSEQETAEFLPDIAELKKDREYQTWPVAHTYRTGQLASELGVLGGLLRYHLRQRWLRQSGVS
jgi:hypothetical protein